MFTKKRIALCVAFAALAGCSNQYEVSKEHRYSKLVDREQSMQAARGTTYVREIKTEDLAMQRPVFLTAQGKSLRSVLQETLPGYSIIPGAGVNLNDPIDVAAQGMPLRDFIDYMQGTRDLNIEIVGKRVEINNFQSRQWNLAAFATTRSITSVVTSKQSAGARAGEDSDQSSDTTTGSTIGLNLSEDEWLTIMEGARRIIGAPSPEDISNQSGQDSTSIAPSGSNPMNGEDLVGLNFGASSMQFAGEARTPYIEGIRSVGIVTAGGRPSQMRVLDEYFKSAIENATKQVNVQIQAYDVVLTDSKHKAIDWSVLTEGTLNGNPLNFALNTASGIVSNNTWNLTGSLENQKGNSGSALVSFLEEFGRVELQDQPNLTVRNGVPAQIYAGEELTYIADVEQTTDENGVATVTPKLARLKVGVTLAVTVRVLEDDRLLVDVTPVISNLNQYDTVAINSFAFQTPRIALKEFSTQLIVSSGESIHLGGLITEKLTKAIEQLPWQNSFTKAVVNPLFSNRANGIERRELVLVVTPTMIEGKR